MGLTERSDVQKQLKHDNEGIKNHKNDYDNMEPVVMESMLHTTTPAVREGEGGREGEGEGEGREGGKEKREERERDRGREGGREERGFVTCCNSIF